MCDYSLEHYRSRPAQEGEKYRTHRFASGSIGFVSAGDTETAVCMAYDMAMRLEGIPRTVQASHGIAAGEDVVFARLDTGRPYRDGVRFASGAEVTLQQLGPGVEAIVTDALLGPRTAREKAEAL